MKSEDVERLLSICGCSNIHPRWDWINAPCPFASWRHGKGTDKKPSFGVRVDAKGASRVRCLSCGVIGTLNQFVWRLARYRKDYGEWFVRASRLVNRETPSLDQIDRMLEFAEDPKSFKEKLQASTYGHWSSTPTTPKKKQVNLDSLNYVILPEADIEKFKDIPPPVMAYLTGPRRKLTSLTVELWGIGWQAYQRRIVIPMRDWSGKLVAVTGRAMDRKVEGKWIPERQPKFMHSKGFHRDFFLFGEHLVERGGTGYLVEGHFDAMYLRQMGFGNAVATMGSHLSGIQVEKCVTLFNEVVILPDGDQAGGEAAIRWEHALKGRVPVAVADCVPEMDPDDYDEDELDDLLFVDNLKFG